jgi:DNA-binding MarR family transcriptional regulator
VARVNSGRQTSIAPNDQRIIQILLWALKPLTDLGMPLPFMIAFLMVALDEGLGVNAYARAAGIHRAAMSRTLHAIADRARNGAAGLGLVRIEQHSLNSAQTHIFLTPKGRSLVKKISVQLRRIK